MTFSLAVLDPVNHRVTVVNAGHMPPIRRDGRTHAVEELGYEEGGPPLGCDPGLEYGQVHVPLKPGDTVLMYTDGIHEAMNDENQLYGSARLRTMIANGPDDVEQLGQTILRDIQRFVGRSPQNDDMCLVAFGRLPEPTQAQTT